MVATNQGLPSASHVADKVTSKPSEAPVFPIKILYAFPISR